MNRGASLWVKTALAVVLVLVSLPVWMLTAGKAFNAIAFRGQPVETSFGTWSRYFRHYRHEKPVRNALLVGFVAGAVAQAPFVWLAWLLLVPRRRSLYGEAKFATMRDIRRAGLLGDRDDGIILGRKNGKYLTAGLDRYPNIMLAAPPGSGKGVSFVIPNLFNWDHSVLVEDVKLENWTITAGYRQAHGHQVFLFNPVSPIRQTHRWNPLTYISEDPALRIDDLQKLGGMLFPDIHGTDPIWTASSRSLFLGLALYLLETPAKLVTMGQIARESYTGDDKRLEAIIKQRREANNPLSATCVHALEDYLNTSDNTRTSIRKTFTARFELFLNPNIDAATAGSDFDLRDLRKQRMTIYLGITPNNLDRLAPLLNMFFQQVAELNIQELPEHNPALKHQVWLLLDEFAALGKMPMIMKGSAFFRGYGLRLSPIFQSPKQVVEIYGDAAAEAFTDTHHARIIHTPANEKVAAEISRELGTFTMKKTSKSRATGGKGGGSKSETEHKRELLLPQEIIDEVGSEEQLIFAKGCRPILCEKIRWYKDPDFKARVLPPPEVPQAPLSVTSPIESPTETRPVEVRDIETLYDRPLSEFSLNYSDVVIPQGDLSEVEAEALADQLYAAMTR